MAKNRTMRVAILMLALTLITSGFVGGTFAKYTTAHTVSGGSGTEEGFSARVAKFGVEIQANTNSETEGTGNNIGLFKKEYENNGDIVVSSTDYVVAPGTGNSGTADGSAEPLFGLTVTGTPEVAVKVKYEATIALVSEGTVGNGPWEVDGTYYCPLIFTIGDKVVSGMDFTSLADFETALETAVSFERDYAPGTDLATAMLDQDGKNRSELNISWEWPFAGAEGSGQTDALDTALGNAAAAAADATGSAFSVSFEISASVEQIAEIDETL